MVFYLTKFVYVWQYSNGEPVFVYKNRLSNYPAPVCLWHGCVTLVLAFCFQRLLLALMTIRLFRLLYLHTQHPEVPQVPW